MPIKYIVWLLSIITCIPLAIVARSYRWSQKPFVIMLDPAGDARHTGRSIGDSFERGLTLQYAEHIKKQLEQQHPHVTVFLTRFPGDIVYHLQNASLANRLAVDLFISIHFYQSNITKPKLYLYQFSYNDDFIQTTPELSLYPYDQAHLLQFDVTSTWIKTIHSSCRQATYQKLFDTTDIYKLPFKPLIGICAPSIGIEAGLKEKNDWQHYVAPLVDGINAIIQQSG